MMLNGSIATPADRIASSSFSLGGSRSIEAWRPEFLDGLVDGGEEIEMIKHAGFSGVCFDIEETNGGMELVEAFERAFKALTKAGLEVMITTSHSAPYSAKTDEIRIAFVTLTTLYPIT